MFAHYKSPPRARGLSFIHATFAVDALTSPPIFCASIDETRPEEARFVAMIISRKKKETLGKKEGGDEEKSAQLCGGQI